MAMGMHTFRGEEILDELVVEVQRAVDIRQEQYNFACRGGGRGRGGRGDICGEAGDLNSGTGGGAGVLEAGDAAVGNVCCERGGIGLRGRHDVAGKYWR